MAGKETSVQSEYMFSRSFRDSARQVVLLSEHVGVVVLNQKHVAKITPATLDLERALGLSSASFHSYISIRLDCR